MEEIWKEIPNYPDYAVSNKGQVKRIVKSRTCKPKIRKQSTVNGYKRVALSNGQRKEFFVHRLVMLSFVGPCPEGKMVNHIDGVKSNNCVENLEYVTNDENMAHAVRTGLIPHGEDNHNTKVTEQQFIDIRKLYATGEYTQTEIAEKFGVTRSCVKHIIARESWEYLDDGLGVLVGKNGVRPGEKNPNSKLTNEKVVEIRKLYSTGNYICKQLGEIFNVSKNAVNEIVLGHSWKHLL